MKIFYTDIKMKNFYSDFELQNKVNDKYIIRECKKNSLKLLDKIYRINYDINITPAHLTILNYIYKLVELEQYGVTQKDFRIIVISDDNLTEFVSTLLYGEYSGFIEHLNDGNTFYWDMELFASKRSFAIIEWFGAMFNTKFPRLDYSKNEVREFLWVNNITGIDWREIPLFGNTYSNVNAYIMLDFHANFIGEYPLHHAKFFGYDGDSDPNFFSEVDLGYEPPFYGEVGRGWNYYKRDLLRYYSYKLCFKQKLKLKEMGIL